MNRVMNVAILTEFLKTEETLNISHQPSCHLGKRLISTGPFFWGFLPPKAKPLALIFKVLVESGIVLRMEQEDIQYQKLRDLYVSSGRKIVMKILAIKTNSTLITHDSQNSGSLALISKKHKLNQPVIVHEMPILGFGSVSLIYQWVMYISTSTKPIFVQAHSREMSFIYCYLPIW